MYQQDEWSLMHHEEVPHAYLSCHVQLHLTFHPVGRPRLKSRLVPWHAGISACRSDNKTCSLLVLTVSSSSPFSQIATRNTFCLSRLQTHLSRKIRRKLNPLQALPYQYKMGMEAEALLKERRLTLLSQVLAPAAAALLVSIFVRWCFQRFANKDIRRLPRRQMQLRTLNPFYLCQLLVLLMLA